MLRLFVAIGLPPAAREGLARLRGGLPGARWTAPENHHLTLRFIGEVDEGVAADLDDALATIRHPAFPLALKGVGAFGDHLLWAGIADPAPVVALKAKVDAAVRRAGLPAETRRFAPHVTLARLKRPDMARLAGHLADHALFAAPAFRVEAFGLYSSVLGGEQALYVEERRYPLE